MCSIPRTAGKHLRTVRCRSSSSCITSCSLLIGSRLQVVVHSGRQLHGIVPHLRPARRLNGGDVAPALLDNSRPSGSVSADLQGGIAGDGDFTLITRFLQAEAGGRRHYIITRTELELNL